VAALHVRVDDRLLHSEVIYACLPAYGVDRVIVSSNLEHAKSVDGAALSEPVALELVRPSALGARLSALGDEAGDVLVVFGTPLDAEEAVAHGFEPSQIILANRAALEGSRRIAKTYSVSPTEEQALQRLAGAGISVLLQRVPTDEAVTLESPSAACPERSRGERRAPSAPQESG